MLELKQLAKSIVRSLGYEVRRITPKANGPGVITANTANWPDLPYRENAEVGAKNMAAKLSRIQEGGPFEWPNIVALNRAVVNLVGDAKRLIEIGGGTGCFAYEAGIDPSRHILCVDPDIEAIQWAMQNRSRPNIEYASRLVGPDEGRFDLVVSIEVIEHVRDFRNLLQTCAALAPRAIITTPNKDRDSSSANAGPPPYYQHVREWTAGEFYWILKVFYDRVRLFSMPDQYEPVTIPISVTDRLTPLIAICESPYRGSEH